MMMMVLKFTIYTTYSAAQRENAKSAYHQGQNQQFADHHGDSMRTMIMDKFYHFHHHCGITLNADPS